MSFQNYIYIPLDIPKIIFDKSTILTFFDSHKKLSNSYSYNIECSWNYVNIYENNSYCYDILNYIPSLVDILSYLPHIKFEKMTILEPQKLIPPHKHICHTPSNTALIPFSYYATIIDEECDYSFYFKRPYTEFNMKGCEFIFPVLPDTTDFFVMNDIDIEYGIFKTFNQNYRKIILKFDGKIDSRRHFALLDRSIKKYYYNSIKIDGGFV